MDDFQNTLKRVLFKEEGEEETPMEPVGAPDKFNIAHHEAGMKKAGTGNAAGDVLKRHLEAQAYEFKKLKDAYDELVQAVQQTFASFGTYGIEDTNFMKGKLQPIPRGQGQVSDPSIAQAMAGAQDFRRKMQTPITANVDDL